MNLETLILGVVALLGMVLVVSTIRSILRTTWSLLGVLVRVALLVVLIWAGLAMLGSAPHW
ncbi:MAG: hypothetical protein HYV63_14685 [Candidatus Schekmanbacteria bacterium]|nr:hypothetical protein [Candidatus Schekmanbacteria bacterium]